MKTQGQDCVRRRKLDLKAGKLIACMTACMMAVSTAACTGTTPEEQSPDAPGTGTNAGQGTEVPVAGTVAEYSYDAGASITFGDEKTGFIAGDNTVNPAAKETLIELSERDGHPAIRAVSSDGGKIYVGIAMGALLGSEVENAAVVEIGLETEVPGGFAATSGNLYAFVDGAQTRMQTESGATDSGWSVYLEDKNPKRIVKRIPSGMTEKDYLVLTLENTGRMTKDESGKETEDLSEIALYIHTISFKDADGNVLAVDTSARFMTSADGGSDRSNLFGLTGATEVGTPASNIAWKQSTIIPDLSDPTVAELLVPGSVVEISYRAETGNLWVVLPGAAEWSRVGVGDLSDVGEEYSYMNATRNTMQVTYEQIAAVCGDDISGWGPRMEAESDGEWEVFSVKIGTAAPNYGMKDFVVVGEGASEMGWKQADIIPDLSDPAVAEALVPGSVIELTYTSETGEIWIVLPDDGNRTRIGAGDENGAAVCDGNKCYIPFEMIAEAEGTEDITAWGTRMQAEASTAWEVFSVRIGTAAEYLPTNSQVVVTPGEAEGGAWEAADIIADLTQEEIAAAFVPGSVLNIRYRSDGDVLWIVFPEAEEPVAVGIGGWGDGGGEAICNGYFCQIPFETIAEVLGTEDVSAWGTKIQAQSNAEWEVTGVSIGTVK